MDKKSNNKERPVAYPRPTETDNQLKNQPEFIEEKPNAFEDNATSEPRVLEEEKGKGEGS
jgi:hypothetical protein